MLHLAWVAPCGKEIDQDQLVALVDEEFAFGNAELVHEEFTFGNAELMHEEFAFGNAELMHEEFTFGNADGFHEVGVSTEPDACAALLEIIA